MWVVRGAQEWLLLAREQASCFSEEDAAVRRDQHTACWSGGNVRSSTQDAALQGDDVRRLQVDRLSRGPRVLVKQGKEKQSRRVSPAVFNDGRVVALVGRLQGAAVDGLRHDTAR